MEYPLAYHITWGTYGTRLHGDERGTVDRRLNQPGDPIIGTCEDWERMERRKLRFEPKVLSREQMAYIESIVPGVCTRGGWAYHTCAAGPDHVHVVLSAPVERTAIRKWLKRWVGEEMSARWALQDGDTWWAECGSVKWVWDEQYLGRVKGYVQDQRASRG